tara:strand:+ start:293 stop:526 length:234 start_codon:yes stop_codon:yes gene_type:complete
MNQPFELGATQRLFERIEGNQELTDLIDQIVSKCKQASDQGIPMDELAAVCTMGWIMGQDPATKKIYEFILAKAKQQ